MDLNEVTIYPFEASSDTPYAPIPYIHTIYDSNYYCIYENINGKWVWDKTGERFIKVKDVLWNKFLRMDFYQDDDLRKYLINYG